MQGNVLANETAQASKAADVVSGTGNSTSTSIADGTAEMSGGISFDGVPASAGDAALASLLQPDAQQGYTAMQDILTMATPEARMESTLDLVGQIDGDSSLDEGAKLAQAYGMIQAVDDDASMSEDEKKALRKAIATNFRSLSSSVKTYLASVAGMAAQKNA